MSDGFATESSTASFPRGAGVSVPFGAVSTKAGIFTPLDGVNAANATETLEASLRTHVVGALQKTLKAHPEQPLNTIIASLREGNAQTETRTIALPKLAEVVSDATLVSVRHKKRTHRLFSREAGFPLHVEMDPSVDNMITTVAEAKARFEQQLQKDAQAVSSGDGGYAARTTGGAGSAGHAGAADAVGSALSRQAMSSDVTEFGKEAASHLPTTADRVQVFVVTPLGREVVFVDGAPFVGNVRQRRAARDPGPGLSAVALAAAAAAAAGDKGKKKHGGGGDDDDPWSDSNSDGSSVLLDEQEEAPEDLEQEICDAVAQHGLGRRAMPLAGLQQELLRMFSKTAPNVQVPVCRLVVPADRLQLTPRVIDQVDEVLGTGGEACLVPTVVFALGFHGGNEMVVRNVVSVIATTMAVHAETKRLQVNSLIDIVQTEKRRIRIERLAAGNQFTMNPSGYWMKVRERREARDRRREQVVAERKKLRPQQPLPPNVSEQERAVLEAQRAREAEERDAYLKALDRRLHDAALRRQARRSKEDVEAAESITKTFAGGAVIVQSIIRGFLTRRRLRKRNLRRKSFNEQLQEASPTSRAAIIERLARNAHAGSTRNRISSTVQWAIERDVLAGLMHEYPEAMTSLAPRVPPWPKVYRTWLPERHRVPPAHEDDVSSEEETWICTSRMVHPKPQTQRFRMTNPYAKATATLAASGCDLDHFIATCSQHFGKVSTLQRRAFAAIQAKCMHVLHTAYLELRLRDVLPRGGAPAPYFSDAIGGGGGPQSPQVLGGIMAGAGAGGGAQQQQPGGGHHRKPVAGGGGVWSFSAFLAHHRRDLDAWFNMPHLVSMLLHEAAIKHGAPGSVPHPLPSLAPTAPTAAAAATTASGGAAAAAAASASSAQKELHHPQEVPLLATRYVAYEDLHAGKHWASMAESQVLSSGKLAGGAVWNYLRGEGVVQLGPTRVFLVSDTMATGSVKSCLQALSESLKCTRLRWLCTSPFPSAYVHDRPVFACPFSEHLARNTPAAALLASSISGSGSGSANSAAAGEQRVYRSVSQAMLDDKLNPAAAEAKAKAASERLLQEKLAAMDARNNNNNKGAAGDQGGAGGGAGGAGSLANSMRGGGGAGTASGLAGARPGLRAGFVGRTVAGRSRTSSTNPQSPLLGAEGSSAGGADGATGRPRASTVTNDGSESGGTAASGLGNRLAGVVSSVSSLASAASAAAATATSAKSEPELNTHVHLDPVNINDKLSVRGRGFPALSTSGQPSRTSFNSQQVSASAANGGDSSSAFLAKVDLMSGLDAAHMESRQTMSASMVLRSDYAWFGASWLDLDQRFRDELVAQVGADSGALCVLVAARGVEDATPQLVAEGSGGSPSNAEKHDEDDEDDHGDDDHHAAAEEGGKRPSLRSSGPKLARGGPASGRLHRGPNALSASGGDRDKANPSVDVANETVATNSASGITPKSSFGSPRQQQQQQQQKKRPSGLQLLIGRFPTRTAMLEPDVRSFRCTAARGTRIIVTVPLKKANSITLGGGGGGHTGTTSVLGGASIQSSRIGGAGMPGGSQSTMLGGAAAGGGAAGGAGLANRAISGIRVSGTDSRGPTARSASRMTRSMSRVTVGGGAGAGGGAGSLGMGRPRGSVGGHGDDSDGDRDVETPPPEPRELIATPEQTFAKLFNSFPAIADAAFVRFPCLSLGGQPWIEMIGLLLRDTYLHMHRGGADEVCTVVSVSTGDDIFYALVVALVHAILFVPETLGSKARKAAAANAANSGSGGGGNNNGNSFASSANSPNKSGGVRFGGETVMGGGGGAAGSASASPARGSDHISRLSTGLDKKASRRFNAAPRAAPPDAEDLSMPAATPEELEAFACVRKFIDSHEVDSLDLSYAAMELDCMIHRCGFWTTFKMPVIMAKQKAEACRASPLDTRHWVREACCGLERYLWLLVVVRCLMDYRASNPRRFNDGDADARASLSVQKNAEAPMLLEFVERRLGADFFRFLYKGIDPWQQRPKLSPDPLHMHHYSMFPQRWFRPYFTPSVV